MKIKQISLVVGVAIGLLAANVNASVIDFEDIAIPSGTYTGGGVVNGDFSSGGFLFDNSTNHYHLVNNYAYAAANGTTYAAFDNWAGNNVTTMSMTSGGLFNLTSIDFSEFWNTDWTKTLTVTGSGGQTAVITLDGINDELGPLNDFQTELFGWTDLSWVSFDSNDDGTGDNYWGMDNITYSSVPEPATLSLLGLGLLGLGLTRRRK